MDNIILIVWGFFSILMCADVFRLIYHIVGHSSADFMWYLCRPIFGLIERNMVLGFLIYVLESVIVSIYLGYVLK